MTGPDEDGLRALCAVIAGQVAVNCPMSLDALPPFRNLQSAVACASPNRRVVEPHGYRRLVEHAALAATDAGTVPIANALLALRAQLPWTYHYAPRHHDDDLAGRVAFAELIGPDGSMSASGCRVGFTVMAENTLYPMHAHPAVELYLVISGNARWQTPGADRMVPPGAWVLHTRSQPHAMQTLAEPLLALWSWTGDIDSPAAYL